MHGYFISCVNDMYTLYIWGIWQEQGANQGVQNKKIDPQMDTLNSSEFLKYLISNKKIDSER